MPSPNPMTARPGVIPRSQIEVRRARTLAEALDILSQGIEQGRPWMPLAGGTDLMVWINQRSVVPERVLDLWPVDGLRGIEELESEIALGALSTYTDIINNAAVQEHIPALAEAARQCGAKQIQNRGTLGGNIAGGSPAGDSLPVLSAWDATLTLVSNKGTRVVPFADFYTGYRQNLLDPDELILRIGVPKSPAGTVHVFHKVGTRMAQSISKVMLGFRGHKADDGTVTNVGIAFGSVAPTVLRLTKTEDVVRARRLDDQLIEEARLCAEQEVVPIDDVRSTAQFRRRVAGNLTARYLRQLEQA